MPGGGNKNPAEACNQGNVVSNHDFPKCQFDNSRTMEIGQSNAAFQICAFTPEVIFCASVRSPEESQGDNACCWGFTFKELEEKQAEDNKLAMLLAFLRDKTEPDEGKLFLSSPDAKYYWINRDMFKLVQGVIFRMKPNSKDLELVVPTDLQTQAIEWHHDLPSAGHQGVARTKAKIQEKFFWRHISKDVERYVLTCDVCNRNKKSKCYGKAPLTEYQAGAPMERVHIDFLGPLPRTSNGNEHCLMMVDQFTKWVECVPLPSQKAEVAAKAAIDTFFTRFGYPFQLFSDQGRNFQSKVFEAVCKALQIHKARTTPYRPSSNGQVERFNRTLMDAVRCFIGKTHNKWDEKVQQIAGAIRASVNRSTGYTPNKLMLGREVNTPAQLMFPMATDKHEDVDEFVCDLLGTISLAHETARANLRTASKRMKRDYDVRVLLRPYQEGDVVYLMDTAVLKGKCRKLCSPWKGPGVISKKLSAYLYQVKLRNSVFVVNHDRMMPCRDRKLPAWIVQHRSQDQVDPDNLEDEELHCVCEKPWQGRFMIQCDFCDKWYHGSCVNISPSDALDIDKYRCGACRKNIS